jgi:hypothetical protein
MIHASQPGWKARFLVVVVTTEEDVWILVETDDPYQPVRQPMGPRKAP